MINRYLGYWDANPATLIPLSPADSAPLCVEMMGGAEKIFAKGEELHQQGRCREAMEILNKLVYAEPDNQFAKDLLADVFEQIGYQKERPSVRNSFLAAAFELRHSLPSGVAAQPVNPDLVIALSTELFLDFLAIRVDRRKSVGLRFPMNLQAPDHGEQFIVELNNSTLTNIKGLQLQSPDLTLVINRSPNSLALGVHVAKSGYVVAEHCRRQGTGRLDSERCSPTWW